MANRPCPYILGVFSDPLKPNPTKIGICAIASHRPLDLKVGKTTP